MHLKNIYRNVITRYSIAMVRKIGGKNKKDHINLQVRISRLKYRNHSRIPTCRKIGSFRIYDTSIFSERNLFPWIYDTTCWKR